MKRRKFTAQEKEILLQNENVIGVSEKNIKYSPQFKIKAVEEYINGNSPMKIFLNAKFDIDILGRDNPERCVSRWKNTFKKLGEDGLLNDQRGKSTNVGRPRIKELTIEEAKARIAYLEAENDFLKKLKALERGVI